MTDRSDAELYSLACNGDRGAVRDIVERYHQVVLRVAHSMLDYATAQDVAQTTWFNVFKHFQSVAAGTAKPIEHLGAYLRTATHNAAVDVYRIRQRRPQREIFDTDATYHPDFSERLTFMEARKGIWRALEALSDKCRELLMLFTVDPPLSYADIAGMLGKPIGYIGPTRQRCLRKLRAAMEQRT